MLIVMDITQALTKKEWYRFITALVITVLFFMPLHIPFRRLFINDLSLNIFGGIVVAALIEAWIVGRNYFDALKFRNIFGNDVNKDFFLVYGLMKLSQTFNSDGTLMRMPYFKPEVPDMSFGNLTPASAAQLRGAQYISQLFGKNVRTSPVLATDVDVKDRMDISYCSIGGRNNVKTIDIENSKDNTFYKFNESLTGIVGKDNGQSQFIVDGLFDYGFIIKIKPKSIDRTWIGIAGLGEWGTSGGAWYLARNWKVIEKKYGDRPFGLIVKVKAGVDESAELVHESV
jgi:hypothetical protein